MKVLDLAVLVSAIVIPLLMIEFSRNQRLGVARDVFGGILVV
jgi:hypothetical protein